MACNTQHLLIHTVNFCACFTTAVEFNSAQPAVTASAADRRMVVDSQVATLHVRAQSVELSQHELAQQQQQFSVQQAAGMLVQLGELPRARTCFNLLLLSG
jgi:hypothetical protein